MNGPMNESLIKNVKTNLLELIHKIGKLSGYDIDVRTEDDVIILG